MFYVGDIDPGDREFFERALQRFQRMFRRMIALDNVILFDRNLGYQHGVNFIRAFHATARTSQDQTLELRLNTLAWGHSCAAR
jgi:hypothetical protein